MFFKTNLCYPESALTLPIATLLMELRNFTNHLPPNWQHHIVSAHERHHRGSGVLESTITDSLPESQRRSSKGRLCKNFLTDGWCPYGDNCTFLHDNYYSTTRESVTISVTPTFCAAASNWKTRLCNKWEKTGSCSFGTNCYFAHGVGGKI
ncbi:hypothetical protein ACH5RR_019916 [Cinchona calisaya]|uniref:C3H1-type domain-containing protein n=1 Tax=Cinchona calisaya TaxID=153742 RepID=A0ABD2ZTI0_9GENT